MIDQQTESFRKIQNDMWRRKAVNFTELKNQALIDPLTELFNKRFLYGDVKTGLVGILESTFKDAERGRDPLSLIMLDIDNFKAINDTHGHLVGDLILKNIAKVIKTHIRDSDFAIRFGGEEICIILPTTNKVGGAHKAEEIRQVIEKLVFEGSNMPNNITITAGVSTYVPGKSKAISDKNLCYSADKAMYFGKQNGRNQTWIVSEKTTKKGETILDYKQFNPPESTRPQQAGQVPGP
ncbi:MAG: GGDEF domain-containing protein [Candidatus Roizmanbacteria bacterium]